MNSKKSQFFDEYGNPINPKTDSIDDVNLPPGVQALIETRLNGAVDRLRELNQADLKVLLTEQSKKWRHVALISSVFGLAGVVWGFFSWFVAPQQIKEWVREFVQQRMTEPQLRQAADEAIRSRMAAYVDDKVRPLETRADRISSQIETMSSDLAAKQAQLVTNQATMRRQLSVQELALSARTGGLVEYKELERLAAEQSDVKNQATVALREINWYFELDRASLVTVTLVDPISRANPGYSVEEAVAVLYGSDAGNRQAAANFLHDQNRKNTVQDLCEVLAEEKDLIVIARITRTLEKITGNRFAPLGRDGVLTWWSKHSGDAEYQSPYRPYLKAKDIVWEPALSMNRVDEAIRLLEETETKEPDALHSKCVHATLLIMKGQLHEAESKFQDVEKKDKDFRWLNFWRPVLFLAQTNETMAVTSLNKAMERSPMLEPFVRAIIPYQPMLTNTNIVWPSKKKLP
jgi:hypothetical protein